MMTCWTLDRLYQEKLEELDDKIQKVTEGNAPEYLHPQKELQRILSQRIETAEAHRSSKVRSVLMTISDQPPSSKSVISSFLSLQWNLR